MELVALKEAFRAAAVQGTGTTTFVFDDMSKVNSQTKYDVMLLKPPDSGQLFVEDPDMEDYLIDYFIFTPEENQTAEQRLATWEVLKKRCKTFNDKIISANDEIIEITTNVSFQLGHHMHGQRLIAVRCQFTLRVFDCVT